MTSVDTADFSVRLSVAAGMNVNTQVQFYSSRASDPSQAPWMTLEEGVAPSFGTSGSSASGSSSSNTGSSVQVAEAAGAGAGADGSSSDRTVTYVIIVVCVVAGVGLVALTVYGVRKMMRQRAAV